MNLLKILYIGILIFFLKGCVNFNRPKIIVEQQILFQKEATLDLLQSNGELISSLNIEIANSPYERETGLMYRTNMEKNQGMLFIFDEESVLTFYMKNTYMSLDLIFINEKREIVSIFKNAMPNDVSSISSKLPSKYVLEVIQGVCDNLNLKIGDRINYQLI
tara:strand:+ start:126 stop:611 length:486 start_codon:yes stop_codon:yes gene_type:complete